MYNPFPTPKYEEEYCESIQCIYHGRHFGLTADTPRILHQLFLP